MDRGDAAVTRVALTIAGSDSGGGAGVEADLKTFAALGVHGCVAITAITAQNTRGVRALEALSPGIVAAQIEAVFEDFDVGAVKIGMLASPDIAAVVAERLAARPAHPFVVFDPVMAASAGVAGEGVISFLSSIADREAIAFGEAIPIFFRSALAMF